MKFAPGNTLTEADEKGSGNQINVVLHWFDELKQEQPK